MAVAMLTLSESFYPADQSDRVLDTTVGGILRDAAQAVPDQPALISGHPDPAQRRRWTYGDLLQARIGSPAFTPSLRLGQRRLDFSLPTTDRWVCATASPRTDSSRWIESALWRQRTWNTTTSPKSK